MWGFIKPKIFLDSLFNFIKLNIEHHRFVTSKPSQIQLFSCPFLKTWIMDFVSAIC
jgi:hypothetical protein